MMMLDMDVSEKFCCMSCMFGVLLLRGCWLWSHASWGTGCPFIIHVNWATFPGCLVKFSISPTSVGVLVGGGAGAV